MGDRITKQQFVDTYVPMAMAGETALAIANALGVNKDTDEAKSQFVSQKASIYRRNLYQSAFAKAVKAGQSEEDAKATAKATADKLPRLQSRTRNVVDDFESYLDNLIANCDNSEEDEGEGDEAPE